MKISVSVRLIYTSLSSPRIRGGFEGVRCYQVSGDGENNIVLSFNSPYKSESVLATAWFPVFLGPEMPTIVCIRGNRTRDPIFVVHLRQYQTVLL